MGFMRYLVAFLIGLALFSLALILDNQKVLVDGTMVKMKYQYYYPLFITKVFGGVIMAFAVIGLAIKYLISDEFRHKGGERSEWEEPSTDADDEEVKDLFSPEGNTNRRNAGEWGNTKRNAGYWEGFTNLFKGKNTNRNAINLGDDDPFMKELQDKLNNRNKAPNLDKDLPDLPPSVSVKRVFGRKPTVFLQKRDGWNKRKAWYVPDM